MKLLGIFGAFAASVFVAAPATAAVTLNGSVAVAVVGVSSDTASIDYGTTFTNTLYSVVGTTDGDFAGIGGVQFNISALTAAVGTSFTFLSAFGDYSGTVTGVDVAGGVTNRTVSAYVLGVFSPKGALAGYIAGPASTTFSFTQTGLSATTSGSFTLASPPAPITSVPEPATWGLLVVGFGLMGASLRYRRRSANVRFG